MSALAPRETVKRLEQVLWMLDYLDDIDADFLRFYHIDDYESMHSVRFFKLAYRLPVYEGVLTVRMQKQQEKQEKRTPGGKKFTGPDVTEVPMASLDEFIERG